MKKIISTLLIIAFAVQCLCCCKKSSGSTFSIVFIDVGQGDSALVECDGNYMLIDGGGVSAGNKVKDILIKHDVRYLNFLIISHMHQDHYGGISKALEYASVRGKVLSNTKNIDDTALEKLNLNITVPHVGDSYRLGSAIIEIVDVSNSNNNDSLVVLITYGKTKFLFTGDIEEKAQTRISDKYQNDNDEPYKIDVMKMPHHGSQINYKFLRTFMPEYAVISAGKGYDHPNDKTLEMLKDENAKVFRTDINGDITVKSDGEKVMIETEKNAGVTLRFSY